MQDVVHDHFVLILVVAIALVTVWKGVKVVPQSQTS